MTHGQIKTKEYCTTIKNIGLSLFFVSTLVLFHKHSPLTGQQGKGEAVSLIPLYHFHLLHRHLDINRAITADSSPLDIASDQTRNVNLWFPSASP